MKLFLVFRQGVNMQGIVGIFDTKELAVIAAGTAKSKERDNYHTFEIEEFNLNTLKSLRVQ